MLAFRRVLAVLLMLGFVTGFALAKQDTDARPVTDDEAKWLLDDAEMIFKVNIKQLMASAIMKKGGVEAIKQGINSNEQAKAIIEAAKLDVTKDIDTLLASAVAKTPTEAKARIVIRGRFDPAKIQTALAKRDEVKTIKEGGHTLFEITTQGNSMYAGFANDNTLVVTQDKESTVEGIKSGGKNAAKISKKMQTAMQKFSGKESLAMAFVINDDLRKMMQGQPQFGEAASKLQTVTAALSITDNVDMIVRGITGDAKSAGQLQKLLDVLIATAKASVGDEVPPAVQDIINAVKTGADKEAVKIELKVTKEMLEKANK
jgi:hypothetical protein